MRSAHSPWSDERCQWLRRLWAEGLSASEIAKQLGTTRSGVLGKVMRLGLTPRKSTEFKPGPPRPKAVRTRPVILPLPPAPPAPPEPEKKPRMRRLQLMQLTERQCRWPIGDPRRHPFYFCAADRDPGNPYCPHHMRKAFARPRG
jgi:GcrA cell cycle regulator